MKKFSQEAAEHRDRELGKLIEEWTKESPADAASAANIFQHLRSYTPRPRVKTSDNISVVGIKSGKSPRSSIDAKRGGGRRGR